MSTMSLNDLYAKLRSKAFSDPSNGDLFYNFFMFQYPAAEEYKWRRDILDVRDKLEKPADYLDTLVLNIFDEFCDYLDKKPFGTKNPSMLKYLLDKEGKGGPAIEQVQKSLTKHAESDEFIQYLHSRIEGHITKQDDVHQRPYVFIYGMGQMFPYLRANTLLTKYERLNKSSAYKVILFYPGKTTNDGTRFRLFDLLDDDHNYRAHPLINDED